MPIFGYNSYIYDEIAIGNRIVQGVFTINFTSPRYVEDIIKNIERLVLLVKILQK